MSGSHGRCLDGRRRCRTRASRWSISPPRPMAQGAHAKAMTPARWVCRDQDEAGARFASPPTNDLLNGCCGHAGATPMRRMGGHGQGRRLRYPRVAERGYPPRRAVKGGVPHQFATAPWRTRTSRLTRPMDIRDSVLAAIGNTPLIKLKRASEETGCTILGKAEFMNPGHSVKDRAALGIITDAIDKGALREGGMIVDGTAGNTGIGLAIVGNALGMKTVIVIPETQAQEKKDTLRALGASLIEVPAGLTRTPTTSEGRGRTAERLAREHAQGAIFATSSTMSPTATSTCHHRSGNLGADWRPNRRFRQRGRTGGTWRAWRSRCASETRYRHRLADVPGAALYNYYTTGESKLKEAPSPKASARAASPPIWKASKSTRPISSPTRKASASPSTCSRMKGLRWACPRASTSRARSAWPASLGRARPSSPCCATPRPATSRACSTPNSCAPRG